MRPAPRSAVERRAGLAEFSQAELARELAERGAVRPSFGYLADLLEQARTMARGATDPQLRRKHARLYWYLRGELRQLATGRGRH
jgi:hypothetical protein